MSGLKIKKSYAIFQRAKAFIPGGAVTESKKPTSLFGGEEFPAYFKNAHGAIITDVDGNKYIDYCMALGPILLGYNYPDVNRAIENQLKQGGLTSLCNEKVVLLAEKFADIIPCAEMTRFLKTGAEAVAAAVRVSRAYTGRDKVLTCGYHGWHDWCNLGEGVPKVLKQFSFPFEFNNIESFKRLFNAHKKELACVVMEPVIDKEPSKEFLDGIRNSCNKAGVVLVFDEIKTGFRMSIGGAQERYGVVPDLAVFGKGMANGMPLAALVGKKEQMKVLQKIWVSSTYAGDVLSIAACLKVLEIIQRKPVLEHIWHLGGKMLDGFQRIALKYPELVEAGGIAPMNFIRFHKDIDNCEKIEKYFFTETLKRGILLKRIAYNFICYSHTERQIDYTLQITDEIIGNIRKKSFR
ncbi:MAG: aminotransferase class III-fold pyridoxal phosphate-dependent enzyme [Planctomycetota bacterium]